MCLTDRDDLTGSHVRSNNQGPATPAVWGGRLCHLLPWWQERVLAPHCPDCWGWPALQCTCCLITTHCFFLVFNRGTLKQQAEQQASLFIISFPNKVWRLIVLSRSRVFCLQRKTLLYLYCFLFHFYYLGLPFVFVQFLFSNFFFSYKFFAHDFLEMVWSIFWKLSDLINNDLNLRLM